MWSEPTTWGHTLERRVATPRGRPLGVSQLGRLLGSRAASALLAGAIALPTATILSPAALPLVAQAQGELQAGSAAVVAGTDNDGARLRQAPGLSASTVGLLAEGARVQVLDGPRAADGYQWYQVRAADAGGWMAARYLRSADDRASLTPLSVVATAASAANTLRMQIVGYNFPAARNPRTTMGTAPRWGTVAVDPQVIPLGTRLTIEGFEGTVFVAEDTGAAVRGLILDVWFDDLDSARRFGNQTRTVTLLGR